MDVRLLETFRTVIQRRSATGAAKAMGVTQPAVSAQIARLEDAVGFQLFERANGRLKPTSDALLFYAETSRVLSGFERLAEVAEHIRNGQTGQITVASHPSAAISLLPGIVAEFQRSWPDVTVRMVTRDSEVVRSLLPAESFDVGVAELPISEAEVKVSKFALRCVAILAEGDELTRFEVITPEHLSGRPFVATFRARMVHDRIQRAFADAGCVWSVCVQTEFFASACGLVVQGAGVGIVDPCSARHFGRLGLVTRPFEPAIDYEIGVFHSLRRDPSGAARSFWDLLRAKLATEEAPP